MCDLTRLITVYCCSGICIYLTISEDKSYVSKAYGIVYIPATTNNNESVTNAVGPGSVTETNDGPTISHEITTFSEQSALTDMVVGTTMPSYDMNPYKDDTLSGFLQRPRIIDNVEWTDVTPAGELLATLDPYLDLLTSTPFRNKIENFQYFKAGLRIGVRTNGTPFHYGKLMIVWKPMIGSQSGQQQRMRDNIFTSSGYPNVIVSPTENEVNEMVVPFAYDTAYIDLSLDVMRSPGRLFVYVLNPLALDSDVPPVSITVFANFEDVKLAGQSGIVNLPLHVSQGLAVDNSKPNPVSTGPVVQFEAQGDVVTEARAKSTAGIISGPAKAVSSVAGALVNIPVLGMWATAVAAVSGAMGTLAEKLGYCKPNTLETLRPYIQKNGDFAAGEGLDSAIKTQVIPSEYVSDIFAQLGGGSEQMTMLDIAGTPSLLGMFTWDGNNFPDDRLFVAPVNPSATTVVQQTQSNRICSTVLHWATRPFQMWRGSLRYDVQITCSNFHSGRLRVSFQPKNSGVVSGFDYQNTINRIVDIQTETDFSFTIPYVNDKPWSFVNRSSIYNSIGFIEFSVVNDLTHTTLPVPEVYINVWVSAGPDFQVAMPVRSTLKQFGPVPVPVSNDEPGEDEQSDEEGFEAQGLTSEEIKTRDHPPLLPGATGAIEHNICQVDTVTHIKQVTNRPALWASVLLDSASNNEAILDTFYMAAANEDSQADYIDWFSNLFIFNRGSLNVRAVPSYAADVTQYWMWMRTAFAINGFRQTTRVSTAPEGYGQQLFTTIATPAKEINVPYYSMSFARLNGGNDTSTWSSCLGMQLAKPSNLGDPTYDVYRSTGDDYSFNYRVGAPSYYLTRATRAQDPDVSGIVTIAPLHQKLDRR